MAYSNGIAEISNGHRVRINVGGKTINRTFSTIKYGDKNTTLKEARRFVQTRKQLCSRKSKTGIPHVYENIVKKGGVPYLYLIYRKKGMRPVNKCIGNLNKHHPEQLRIAEKYQNALMQLKLMSMEPDT